MGGEGEGGGGASGEPVLMEMKDKLGEVGEYTYGSVEGMPDTYFFVSWSGTEPPEEFTVYVQPGGCIEIRPGDNLIHICDHGLEGFYMLLQHLLELGRTH